MEKASISIVIGSMALVLVVLSTTISTPSMPQGKVLRGQVTEPGCDENTWPYCGEGSCDDDEVCIDSGVSCACEPMCGQSIFPECGDGSCPAGEVCTDSGDSCDCEPSEPFCGNGIVEEGEECDPGGICEGGAKDGALCWRPTSCPGGTCVPWERSDCDDDCTEVECGDGNLNEKAGEECDDGNNVSGDGCDANCMFEPSCAESQAPQCGGHCPTGSACGPNRGNAITPCFCIATDA